MIRSRDWIVIRCNGNKNIVLNSQPKLKYLSCGSCNLEILDVSYHVNLIALFCQYNKLVRIVENKGLKVLYCHNNKLKFIQDIPGLEELHCHNNSLSSLPHITSLRILSYHGNKLTCRLPIFHNLISFVY
jgi:Leucine-rich repeat (LRR) protein